MNKLMNLNKIFIIFCIFSIITTISFAQSNGRNCFRNFFEREAVGESTINSYLLMYVDYYMYENRIGASNFEEFKKKFKEIMQPLGFDTFNFINVRKGTADTQAVVMSNEKLLVVAFRGSESSSDGKFSPVKVIYDWLLTDFNFFKRTVFSWGWGVRVHYGFYKALNIVYKQLKADILEQLSGTKKKLWITGHSLGGGIAPLAAFRLNKDNIDIQGIYTYGAPRVGNKKFASLFHEKFPDAQRWVNDKDLVTKLPFKFMKYVHYNKPNNIYADGHIVKQDTEFKGVGKATSHKPIKYLQALYDVLPDYVKDEVPAPPTSFRRSISQDTDLINEIQKRIEKQK